MLAFSQPPTEKDHSATGFHKHQQNAPMLWEQLGISVSARPPSLRYQTAIISGSFRTNEVSPKGNENSVVCFLEQDGETTWRVVDMTFCLFALFICCTFLKRKWRLEVVGMLNIVFSVIVITNGKWLLGTKMLVMQIQKRNYCVRKNAY